MGKNILLTTLVILSFLLSDSYAQVEGISIQPETVLPEQPFNIKVGVWKENSFTITNHVVDISGTNITIHMQAEDGFLFVRSYDEINQDISGLSNGNYKVTATFESNYTPLGSLQYTYDLQVDWPEPVIKLQPAVELSWLAYSGITYQAQYSTNLVSTNWFDLGNVIIGDGTTNQIFDSTRSTTERFYRVIRQ